MDTSKLAKRLQRIQERQGGGKNIWFKSSEDKAKIRLVPYPHESDGSPFIEVGFHYNVAGQKSLVCPRVTHGEPCPICELAEEFRNMGTKDGWAMYKKYAAKVRTYSPVLVRGQEDDGVKLWGYGVTIYESLVEKFLDEDWGDLSDISEGHDLTVWSIPAKSAGNDSDFVKPKLDVTPKASPMLGSKAAIKKVLEEIPDYLNDGETFPVKSYQELQELVRKLSDAEDDDYEEEKETSYSSKGKSKKFLDEDEDDDDSKSLNSKLDDLLKD